ncbi:hypothetical protein [Streptomyces sp. NPDC049590]|uniref:hypothetical protein n=1 Tax=Streptomyces sp. NPDC049590 TaxID=3154834 RepID=UPI0034354507
MEITPVIATLVGAGFGSFTTAMVALGVQKATRTRERENKLWERQVAVIEESLKHERALALKRQQVMSDPQSDSVAVFDVMSGVYKDADVAKISTNLELYGTTVMQEAHAAAFEAFREWLLEFFKWQTTRKLAEPGQPEQVRADAELALPQLWPSVEALSAKADAAYAELVEVMRATAIFEPVVKRVNQSKKLPR